MATNHQAKRRAMDAIAHSETQMHLKMFRGARHAAPQAVSPVKAIKRLAMDAVSNVETVAQVGTMRLVGGIALYTAHIREMDREAQRDAALRNWNKAQEKLSREDWRE